MPELTCDRCLQEFTKKDRYDSHLARKNPCKVPKAVKEIIQEKIQEEIRKINITELILPVDKKHQEEILQKFFEDLHNLLWNKAGLNPERALEHMTFFFAYRLIEIQADNLSLPKECRWSFLANHSNENDAYDTLKKGCQAFQKNTITKPFFKKPEIERADIIFEIIRQINRIPIKALQETDTLGNIFEYMIGRGMSTMSDEGQYFTNRSICRLAFKLSYDIKRTLRRKDGSLCTFADWFCGTGGFPAEYVKGVNDHVKNINWEKESSAIYCQDMNVSSVTTTLLNMLILTGIPFESTNIRSSNSFSDPIVRGGPFKDLSIDYCFMNPPYGGDKSKGKEYKFAYAKGKGVDKKYLVNADIQSIGIEDDDKVSAGVQLAMATLSENGGVCCIVLPQGFFFGASKKCVELRKKIAEEYKIWYVVDIASGSFLNTGTKTSMMVFQKGVGETEKVSFIGLDEKLLVEATLEELREKHYSLNYKQYLPQSAVEVEGFEMVKLGDVVSFKTEQSKKDKNFYTYIDIGSVDRGKFKSGDTITKENLPGRAQYSVKIGDILLGTVRPNLEHYLLISPQIYRDDLIVSNGFSIMRCDTNKVLPTYLYSILTLSSTTAYLTERATGTTYPVVDDAIIGAMEIPLPSLERQQQIVEAIDGWASLAQNEEISLKMLEKQMMFQVKEMGRGQARVKLGTISKDITFGFMVASGDYGTEGVPVIKTKNIKTKRVMYPADDQKIKTKLDDKYKIRKGDMVIVLGGSPGENGIWEFDEEAWLNQDCAKISIENPITRMFVFYSLQGQGFNDYIESNTTKTTIGHISRGVVREIEIPLPPLTEQQTLQSDFDEIRHKHAKIAIYKAKAQEAIQRLIPVSV